MSEPIISITDHGSMSHANTSVYLTGIQYLLIEFFLI